MSDGLLSGQAAFEPALAKMLRPPKVAVAAPVASHQDGDSYATMLKLIERGGQAMLASTVNSMRAKLARQWEEEILEGLPQICEWVKSDIDELAKRKEATRKTYRRRFARFQSWALEMGFDKMPYEPAVVARFIIDEANRGVSIGDIKTMRSAIAACHRDAGYAEPCHDPLVRSLIRYLDSKPDAPDDGGQPAPEQQKQEAA